MRTKIVAVNKRGKDDIYRKTSFVDLSMILKCNIKKQGTNSFYLAGNRKQFRFLTSSKMN